MNPNSATPVVTPMPTRAPTVVTAAPDPIVPEVALPLNAAPAEVRPAVAAVAASPNAPTELQPPVETPAELPFDVEPELAVTAVATTGNTVFDSVGAVLKEKGVDGIDALFKEVSETGAVSLSDHSKIIEALGESLGSLIVNQLTSEVKTVKETKSANSRKTLDYACEKFGVDKSLADSVWADIQAFARSPEAGISADDRKVMSKMIAAGGMQAQLVIDNLHAKHSASQSFTQPAELIYGDTTVGTNFVGLSQGDYTKQMREAVQQYGYQSPEAESLRQRRSATLARSR